MSNTISMFFPQSTSKTAILDEKMRLRLAASLEHIVDRCGSRIGVERIDFRSMLSEITSHRQRPGVYARYFELVFALKGERDDVAGGLLQEIAAMALETPSLVVNPLTRDAMGEDAARYTRLLNAGEDVPVFAPPSSSQWDRFEVRVAAAVAKLDDIDEVLAGEVRALICEVLGSASSDPLRPFGSASSLTLWGCVTLSLEGHRTTLDIVDGLVHESAHLFLFGHAIDEPLVLNPDADRFISPLRPDARPMNGVFHATFVCARLCFLYRRLIEKAGVGLDVDPGALDDRFETRRRQFFDGAKIVAEHARLTETGDQIMRAAEAYMADAAA